MTRREGRESESSLVLSGLCFPNPLPEAVVFDNDRIIVGEI